jgi:excisionase family DNA binding protein
MRVYSTSEAAELLGISWDTLHRWMREKKVSAPAAKSLGKMKVRFWTEKDLEKVRAYKAEHYWGKGGRKERKDRKRVK